MQEYLKKIKRKLNSAGLFDEIEKLVTEEQKTAGQPQHSIRTGFILAKMEASKETIISGALFHLPGGKIEKIKNLGPKAKAEILDIIDKARRLEELQKSFRGFKQTSIKDWHKNFLNQQSENIRKMIFAFTRDIRPVLVIVADWLDEIEHIAPGLPKDRQKEMALIALNALSPLSYSLGMAEIKSQFEDLAFPYLYPKEHKWLIDNLTDNYDRSKAYAERIRPQIEKVLAEKKVKVLDIAGRVKHYFSLYQKLLRHNMDIGRIYDLVALRIIVEDVEACYQTLGALHGVFRPLAGRIKDYISRPKSNGYRSLHTTITGPENKIIEVQIRTPQMHREAEYGVADHLSYKTGAKELFWAEQIRKLQSETKNIEQISELLPTEFFKNRIFIFTPQGDVIDLPKGSTPVDFAFAVHSDIGEHCEGAKVNDKMQPIDTPLQNGDRVEILVDRKRMPSEKWLRFVKTDKAKHKIRVFLDKAYGAGTETKETAPAPPKQRPLWKKILPFDKIPLPNLSKISLSKITKPKKPEILVGGEKGIKTKIALCCRPKPGDKLAAFITQGEGASVHEENCRNLAELQEKWPERIVPAQWQG
ncbi:MAG: TGS domain-containing protein [Patescibacteria group bacterium]|nr:TGS domain-containing protein [Patescibacteria group bacterium]